MRSGEGREWAGVLGLLRLVLEILSGKDVHFISFIFIFFFVPGLSWEVGWSDLLQLSISLIGADETVYMLYALKRLQSTVECDVERVRKAASVAVHSIFYDEMGARILDGWRSFLCALQSLMRMNIVLK